MSDTSSNDVNERSPLIRFQGDQQQETTHETSPEELRNTYHEFCDLIGNRPVDLPASQPFHTNRDSLYYRVLRHRKHQSIEFAATAALINTLLLSQVVLGATLTGLGASNASGVLITVFGAVNTIIAGLVAFLKSRGQPMRSRMFRDDLDRVVDEIENSAIMWRGISRGVHGYDAIDTDDSVTVRSEVARLTRLYDRAVKTNTQNDPDFYGSGNVSDNHSAALRNRAGLPIGAPAAGPLAQGPDSTQAPLPIAGPLADPDESPATQIPVPSPAIAPAKDTSSTDISKNPTLDLNAVSDKTDTPSAPRENGTGPSQS